MYLEHFGLREHPFGLTPNPRFLYLSERHREALAHLLFGVGEGGGFVQLTGEVGTGKTLVCRALLEQVPANVDVALILNPRQSSEELVASICDELGVTYPGPSPSIKQLTDTLTRHLLRTHAEGRSVVVLVDEAQSLSFEALEQVRLLTNLETATHKLLRMVLIGQPELQDLLARDSLRQLAQRISTRHHLTPLDARETAAYVTHRLTVAGADRPLFTTNALRRVFRLTGGVPRRINVLCDRALLGAYSRQQTRVDRELVRAAAREVWPAPARRTLSRWHLATAALGLVVGIFYGRLQWPPQATSTPQVSIATNVTPQDAKAIEPEPPPLPATVEDPTPPVEAPPPVPRTVPPAVRYADLHSPLAELLALWRPTPGQPAPAGDVCAVAKTKGLRCLTTDGAWNRLLSYGRPAVLEMRDEDGSRYFALVVRATESTATLNGPDGGLELTRAAVETHWFGRFTLLWEPSRNNAIVLRPGQMHSFVRRLRRQLADAGFPAAPAQAGAEDLFDEELQRAVTEFQRSTGIEPDGVVGPQTWTRLNRTVAAGRGPTLDGPGPAATGGT